MLLLVFSLVPRAVCTTYWGFWHLVFGFWGFGLAYVAVILLGLSFGNLNGSGVFAAGVHVLGSIVGLRNSVFEATALIRIASNQEDLCIG